MRTFPGAGALLRRLVPDAASGRSRAIDKPFSLSVGIGIGRQVGDPVFGILIFLADSSSAGNIPRVRPVASFSLWLYFGEAKKGSSLIGGGFVPLRILSDGGSSKKNGHREERDGYTCAQDELGNMVP